MGVEVAGSDSTKVNGEVVEQHESKLHQKENGNDNLGPGITEPIKFGLHGGDVAAKGEGISIPVSDVPKDAADEWPEQKQIHSFYFVRVRPYDDPKLKAKIDEAEKEIQKLIFKRNQIFESLKEKKSKRLGLIEQLKPLSSDRQQLDVLINEKRTVMRPLQEALGSVRGTSSLCSSEEELNDVIHSLNYRIQHESIPLSEEKKIIREIKQLEGTREKVIANAAARAKLQEEAVHDKVKLMGSDLGEAKEKRQTVRAQISGLEGELKVVIDDIRALENELDINTKKKEEAFTTIKQLRQQRDSVNKIFYENRTILNQARELAAKKNVKALEELWNEEVEKFMSEWSSTKSLRSDYEKRILVSLDNRQLSRDGRIRNFDEKPIVLVEPSRPTEAAKFNQKAIKEESKPSAAAKQQSQPTPKAEKESKKKPTESKTAVPKEEEEEEVFVVEKPKEEEKKIDESKLKEMKREEEMAKQKQALERKKKLAEKAAAKAAIRAQKEAEKKQKDREKKLKKKGGASGAGEFGNQEEVTEKEPEIAEAEAAEKEDENVEVSSAAVAKSKDQQQDRSATIRSRSVTKGTKGSRSSVQKVILKRKKSNKYWMYAAPAAGVAVVMLLFIAYNYLL